jgi:hypothetical protein
MRIECPHCHHRGFSTVAKLFSTPVRPVRCRYCRHSAHAQPLWSGICLALALIGCSLTTLAGSTPGWLPALATVPLAGGVLQLLRQPCIATHRSEVRRHRRRLLIVVALVALTALGLLAVTQMSNTAPPAAPAASAE